MALEFLSPLHKASRQLSLHLESRMTQADVSPTEGHILTYLRSYAPASVGDLVRVFGIKQSTFTSMLDRLEAGGLVRRDVNPDDRRSFMISLTDRGVELTGRINGLLLELEAEIRSRLTPADVEGFRAVMRAVEEVTRVRLR
jgi:DNA-binding MarR family transcriptional regulator